MSAFNGDRYLTRGIKTKIGLALQILMWGMIDEDIQSGQQMDYLQVFVLKPITVGGMELQQIEHRQEQPERSRTIVVNTGEQLISEKIFVIDDNTHITMLLASEY